MLSIPPIPAVVEDGTDSVPVDDACRLRRRVAELETELATWMERFECSPIPMTVEDWSEAKQIVDGLRARGVTSIVDHVREHPEILARLAPAVKILDANCATVKVYRATDRQQLLAALNEPPDLSTYNPTTGLSDIFVNLLERFANGETCIALEGPDSALDGTRIFIRTTTCIARGREHDWGSVLQTVEDFTRREAAEAEVRRLAMTDALTGLANRRHFESRLGDALSRARRNGEFVALLLVDLDDFKPVNDSFGHGAGDELLRCVGERLQAISREADSVARIGGDEFAVVVSGEHPALLACRPAHRILDVLAEPFEVEGQRVQLGACIGIACFPGDADNEGDLQRRADEALYRAKRGEGESLCYWQSSES